MVKILDGTTRNPLSTIGQTAGICWNSPIDDAEKNVARAKDCILSGHGRVIEWVDINLVIEGYSARCLREYERHVCGASFLQESTRYVDCGGFNYFTPDTVKHSSYVGGILESTYRGIMSDINKAYNELIENGMPKEDAANILPLGMMTKVVDKRNLRNMVNLMNQRLCTRAYKEIRELASEIKDALSDYSEEWKWICENLFVPKCEAVGFCVEAKCCGRKPKKDAL